MFGDCEVHSIQQQFFRKSRNDKEINYYLSNTPLTILIVELLTNLSLVANCFVDSLSCIAKMLCD